MGFLERIGLKPAKSVLQTNSMDEDLKNSLWNLILCFVWYPVREEPYRYGEGVHLFYERAYIHYFKKPIDLIQHDPSKTLQDMRKCFYAATWSETYAFYEFLIQNFPEALDKEGFISSTNEILQRESSGYRITNDVITPISSDAELNEVDTATKTIDRDVNTHIKQALKHFSDRQSPDYRNSIKESISAVEVIVRKITGENTLGEALKKLPQFIEINAQLKSGLEKIYAYTNGPDGIRHAMMEDSTVGFDETKFMLVFCSSFVNYLISKASKAGIKL